jgi:methyl-accepting chemotaxis protein
MPASGRTTDYPFDPFAEAPALGARTEHAHDRRAASPTKAYGSLERAFAATGLVAVAGTAAGAALAARGSGWPALLATASVALLLCALLGIWAQDLVVRFQRGEVAMVYATALQGPRRALADRRMREATRMESLTLSMSDLVDSIRVAVFGRDRLTGWAIKMRQELGERASTSEAVASALWEDAHAIAAAANATRRAEAEITADIGEMWQHASLASEATGNMAAEAEQLAEAVRHVTTQTGQAATLAARLADHAVAAQSGVAAVTSVADNLGKAADQVKAVLQRAEMLGINAGIEAARAGETGRGFAVVAAEVKNLATSGQAALDAMLQVVRGLRAEATCMREMIESMDGTIQAQNLLGHKLADAASHQIEAVGRVVHLVQTAHGEIKGLRDRAQTLETRDLGMGTGLAARKAVERLPEHAEAVAQILRNLPELEKQG